MKLIRIIVAVFLFSSLLVYEAAQAQFIPYSQYSNAPLLTNPARASLTDYTQLVVQYRRSRVGNYETPSLSFIHPFYRQANGLRYGGIGATLIRQQAGPGGLYQITGATGTFAYTLHLSRTSHIGAGIGGGIVNKRIDVSGITTDAQFNFGAYDPSLATGEDFQSNAATRAVVNTGFCWVLTGDDDQERASLGVAAYSINRPSFKLFENGSSQEAITYVASGEVTVLRHAHVSVSPTFRYVYDGTGLVNVGSWVRYTPGITGDVVSAALWYKTTGAIVAAAEYNHKAYVLGASIDFSTASNLDANINNAVEVSLGWRVSRKEKIATRRPTAAPSPEPIVVKEITPVAEPPSEEPQAPAAIAPPADSTATVLTREEEQLAAMQIHFALGSDAVTTEREAFFDDLATTITSHPGYQLKITGHSCTLGDKATNEAISYERANAVAQQLIKRGVTPDRLIVIGMDFQQPIAPNDTEAGRKQNRRVEFEWIKK